MKSVESRNKDNIRREYDVQQELNNNKTGEIFVTTTTTSSTATSSSSYAVVSALSTSSSATTNSSTTSSSSSIPSNITKQLQEEEDEADLDAKETTTSRIPSDQVEERETTTENAVTLLVDDTTPPSVVSVPLNPINQTLYPLYTTGCCGIGHRLSRVVPTIVYANRHKRTVRVVFNDVPWAALFNETEYVQGSIRGKGWRSARNQNLLITNGYPSEWWSDRPKKHFNETKSVLDRYQALDFFNSPLLVSVVLLLRDSLSPLVLSYLNSVRAQLNKARNDDSAVTICAHFRQGNNETGDWESKKWRHRDNAAMLNSTRMAMEDFVHSRNASKVAVYVASDNAGVRPWFEANVPNNWNIVMPEKVMKKPENGVWFGQHVSSISCHLNFSLARNVEQMMMTMLLVFWQEFHRLHDNEGLL